MTEPSQDLFDPSLVFVEETPDRNAVQEHNEYIGNLVLAALHAKKQIAVITSGEEFNANVAKVSSKDGIFQFEFEQCELDDSVFLQQRVYKATDIVDIREPIPTRWQQEADTTRQMTQPQSPPQASPMDPERPDMISTSIISNFYGYILEKKTKTSPRGVMIKAMALKCAKKSRTLV
jgi:hypothetical protein